jgi:hypothetical protein
VLRACAKAVETLLQLLNMEASELRLARQLAVQTTSGRIEELALECPESNLYKDI